MQFMVPDGAETARLLIVAPTTEEINQIESDQTRLLRFRGAFIQVQTSLFGAMPLDFAAMLDEGKGYTPKEPSYGTLNCTPEGYDMVAWLGKHNIPIMGGEVRHQPILDLMRMPNHNGQAATAAFIMNGFAGEPVTAAFAPLPAVQWVVGTMIRAGGGDPTPQLAKLRGFTWVFITLQNSGQVVHSIATIAF